MQQSKITLPAYWAPALINDDYSGMEHDEAERCKNTVDELAKDGWYIVSTTDDDEPRFTWNYQLYDTGSNVSGGEVIDYVIIKSV